MGVIKQQVQRWSTESLLENHFSGAHCIWVLTTGRSGTRTLSRILDNTPGFQCAHEPFPTLTYQGRRAIEGKKIRDAEAFLTGMRAEAVEGAYARNSIYVDCSFHLTHFAEELKRAFTFSRFVHLVRQPRDFVTSAIGRRWYDYETTQGYYWPRPPRKLNQWQSLVWYWDKVHARGLKLEERWGSEAVFRLRSEDLWRGHEGFESLLRWVGRDEDGDLIPRTRGRTYHTLLNKETNASPNKPDWDPDWEDFLQETAGKTMERIYGEHNG